MKNARISCIQTGNISLENRYIYEEKKGNGQKEVIDDSNL